MDMRELFVPFQAQWLLTEEGKLWEGIRDITVGRYMRRVGKGDNGKASVCFRILVPSEG